MFKRVLQNQVTMITTMMGVIIVLLSMIVVLKMTKKYTHNMILMSRYKGQLHGGKRANKFGQGPPPPPFRAMPERKHSFLQEVAP